jgi:hypothetical protein
MKKAVLLQDVELYEDEVVSVFIEEGTVCDVLLEYDNPAYFGGKAVVIFDGKEALSVSKRIVREVEVYLN